MVINEERLKQLVLAVLKELEEDKNYVTGPEGRQKLYLVCNLTWDQRYQEFMDRAELSGRYQIVPVIPQCWQEKGYEAVLKQYQSCVSVRYRTDEKPDDLEHTMTVFAVTDRDTVVKTALCISDTFETSWIADSMEQGGRIVFLCSGLKRFSGREPSAYVEQIMSCYRKVLEYGIEIGELDDLSGDNRHCQAAAADCRSLTGQGSRILTPPEPELIKKRVITASVVEQYAVNGVIVLQQGDIVTDLAKDRAKYLNLVFR